MRSILNSRGQSLIEYVILVALVGVATMGMVRTLQSQVKSNMGGVINALRGHTEAPKKSAVDLEKAGKRLDFGNFMEGAASKESNE